MKTFDDTPRIPAEAAEVPLPRRSGRFVFKPAYRLILVLVVLALILIWYGDQIGGLQVVTVNPPEGATDVSTRTVMQVTFDQKIAALGSGFPLSISPPVSGTVRWEESTLAFVPSQALAPETTYTVTLTADVQSQQGRALNSPLTWQFRTGQPRILYVAPDEGGNDQLFVINPAGGQPTRLTQAALGVWDYSLSPDATTLIYGALRQDGGSDLWEMAADGSGAHLLLACPEAACGGAVWSPDGRRLVYERQNILAPGTTPDPPRLWWLDPATGETRPVFKDQQWFGYGARWSPDSNWLSYVAPGSQGVQVYNINDGHSLLIPSRIGGPAVWSPRGDALLVADIWQQEESFGVHLLQVDPTSGQLTDLSGAKANVEDTSPIFSPDGAWIALTRKVAGAAMGKQLWLMRPDGSEAHYLTNDTNINHGPPQWSPDGRYLLYQRFPLKEPDAQPGVWLLDVESQRVREVITPGNRPMWLP
jgi:Tol biopolymer transport system component